VLEQAARRRQALAPSRRHALIVGGSAIGATSGESLRRRHPPHDAKFGDVHFRLIGPARPSGGNCLKPPPDLAENKNASLFGGFVRFSAEPL